ncbi:MAG: alpha/beta hydrolase [Pseudomonadota bacterium]
MTHFGIDLPRLALSASALCLVACSAPADTVIPETAPAESGDVTTPTAAAEAGPAPNAQTSNTQDTERNMTLNGLSGLFHDVGPDAPVVLIVPGSGPTDRDGNNPMGVNSDMYRMIADGLALEGVSSLRVDKRGMFASSAAGNPNTVTAALYAQDYRDWSSFLRQETGRECIFLMGHSEGALMVSAATLGTDGVCGLVLAAAPGRPLGDILRDQFAANPANAPIMEDAMRAIGTLEGGERVDVSAMHPALQAIFDPSVQDFLISTLALDPVALVSDANVPVLVLQGDRDLQVSVEDARRLEAAGAELVMIEGSNHLLKDAPVDRAGNLATYADPSLPLSNGVVEAVAAFVKG